MADVARRCETFVMGWQHQLIHSLGVLQDGDGAHSFSGTLATTYVPAGRVVKICLPDPRAG